MCYRKLGSFSGIDRRNRLEIYFSSKVLVEVEFWTVEKNRQTLLALFIEPKRFLRSITKVKPEVYDSLF